MFLEGGLQGGIVRCGGHLRQRLGDALFRVVEILQLLDQEIIERIQGRAAGK
jgi:hypothetical protein